MTFQVTTRNKKTGSPVSGILIRATVQQTGQSFVRSSDGSGYSDLAITSSLPQLGMDVVIEVIKEGYAVWTSADLGMNLTITTADQGVSVALVPFDRTLDLRTLARFRGSLFTVQAPGFPYGPRPMDPTNVLFEYTTYDRAEDRKRWLSAYLERGYTHAPEGPLVDPGYHGIVPGCDWRGDNFQRFLDICEEASDVGIEFLYFLRPDGWSLEQCKSEFTDIFQSDRAQRVMKIIVGSGWEWGGRYGLSNAEYVANHQWACECFPTALHGIHLPNDQDGPVGHGDEGTPGQGWPTLFPYLHFWLLYYDGYTSGTSPTPTAEFVANYQSAIRDVHHRFTTGGPAGDWPTSSRWGQGQRLLTPVGEYASFATTWEGWPESQARLLGDLGVAAGADGYMDGGTVPV